MALPVVAIVGRPNVGKSTLFNALTRTRDALVGDVPGLTRDRRYGLARLGDAPIVLIDTGGVTDASDGQSIAALTTQQAFAAVEEADVIVFLVDGREGLTAGDELLADRLRPRGIPTVLAVNKTDGVDVEQALADFYALGIASVIGIAATHRRGLNGLAEAIGEVLPPPQEDSDGLEFGGRRVSVIGRPNVGKSTLINRLINEDRLVTFDMPGTTRDAVEVGWTHNDVDYRLVDTAGIRRRSRVTEAVEKFSIVKTLQAISQSDVVVVVCDASETIVEQDLALLGEALKAGRSCVLAVNKWDGLDDYHRDRVRSELERKIRFAPYVERIFISALRGSGLGELTSSIERAWDSANPDLSTAQVTEILEDAVRSHPPAMIKGRTPRLRYAHPGGVNPPTIVIHGTRVDAISASYRRYLENTYRSRLRLVGTPLRLVLKQGSNPYAGKKNPLSARQLAKRKRQRQHVRKRKRRG